MGHNAKRFKGGADVTGCDAKWERELTDAQVSELYRAWCEVRPDLAHDEKYQIVRIFKKRCQ